MIVGSERVAERVPPHAPARWLSPFASAVRIQSLGSTSSSALRWWRAIAAVASSVSVPTGQHEMPRAGPATRSAGAM